VAIPDTEWVNVQEKFLLAPVLDKHRSELLGVGVDVEVELCKDDLPDVIRAEFEVEIPLKSMEDGVHEAVDFGDDLLVCGGEGSAQDIAVAVCLGCSAKNALGG